MIWCIRMLFGIAQEEKKTNLALQELVNDHHATVCSLWSFVVVCGRLWSAFSPLVITCNYIMAEHGQSWPMSMLQRMQSWCQMWRRSRRAFISMQVRFMSFNLRWTDFLWCPVPNQSQMPQVTTRSMPKRSSNISQSKRCPENGEAASSKGAPPRGLTAFSGRFGTAGGSVSPQESPRYPHKSSQSHIPTGRGFSIVHFETFRRGLVRFRWWEYSHRSHRPV